MLNCNGNQCEMVMIQRYIDSMCDELQSAVEYAEYYIIHKNSHPQWAKMYNKMAEDELVHADYVRTMTQEFVDGLAYVSDNDKECWEKAITYFSEMEMRAKLMLSK